MRVLLGGAALVALSLAWATSALALDVDQDEALRLRQSGEVLSFQAILRQADERYPGARLLEAELDDDDGEFIYEIELLTGDAEARQRAVVDRGRVRQSKTRRPAKAQDSRTAARGRVARASTGRWAAGRLAAAPT